MFNVILVFFIFGGLLEFFDNSKKIFHKNDLFLKDSSKHRLGVPLKEIEYQIKNNTDPNIVKNLKRNLKIRYISITLMGIAVCLALVSTIL